MPASPAVPLVTILTRPNTDDQRAAIVVPASRVDRAVAGQQARFPGVPLGILDHSTRTVTTVEVTA